MGITAQYKAESELLDKKIKAHSTLRTMTDKTFNITVYILECNLWGVFFKDWAYTKEQTYQNARTFYRAVKKKQDAILHWYR